MNEKEKKQMFVWFIMPIVGMIALYFFAGTAVNRHYGQADLRPATMMKYTISRALDAADVQIGRMDIPPEYAGYIYAKGYPAQDIDAPHYHMLLDLLPQPRPYSWFPYFLVFALLTGCVAWATHPVSNADRFKNDTYIRGARRLSAKKFCKLSKSKATKAGLVLPCDGGKLVLDEAREKEHFLILGSTGTGKSSLLLQLVAGWLQRGTRLLIVDRKGEFYSHFGRRGDILFNPFDSRGVGWSIFSEFDFIQDADGKITRIPPDLQNICDILCGVDDPRAAAGNQKFWLTSASGVLISSLCWLGLHGKTKNVDVVEFFNQTTNQILAKFKELPAPMQTGIGALGGDPDTEQAAGVMSTLHSKIAQLATCSRDGDFSVSRWARSGGRSNLYLSTAGRHDTSFTTIIALLIELVGKEVKEYPDNGAQQTRLVFLIDELSALPPMPSMLSFLLTQTRSKGVSVVIANQTVQKIEQLYQTQGAKNLVACAKSRFIFAMPEASDARYLSDTIGKAEVQRLVKTENQSKGGALGSGRGSDGESKQITQDAAFLAAEIAGQKTGECIVSLPNLAPMAAQVKLGYTKYPMHHREYEPLKEVKIAAADIMQPTQPSQPTEAPEAQEAPAEEDAQPVEAQEQKPAKKKGIRI